MKDQNEFDDIDGAIKEFRKKLRANSVPLRLRDKRLKSNDGYPDYVTQAEMDATAILNANYRESIKNLELLKRVLEDSK
jgi:hypothetical protein